MGGFQFNGCFHPLRRYILFRPPWWAFHVSGSRRKQKQQKRSPRFVLVPFINNLSHNCHYTTIATKALIWLLPVITIILTIAFIPHSQSYCLLPSPSKKHRHPQGDGRVHHLLASLLCHQHHCWSLSRLYFQPGVDFCGSSSFMTACYVLVLANNSNDVDLLMIK